MFSFLTVGFYFSCLHTWPEKERTPPQYIQLATLCSCFVFKSIKTNKTASSLLLLRSCEFHTIHIACSCQIPYSFLIRKNKHVCTLIYFTAPKLKMHWELSQDFKKQLLRGVIIEVVIFSLMLFVCNWEFGSKRIMFIYIFFPQCNTQGLLIYTIILL